VVWFGEMPREMERIYEALGACDLFIPHRQERSRWRGLRSSQGTNRRRRKVRD
jgi:hypothetical protein